MAGLFSGITNLIDGGAGEASVGVTKDALEAAKSIPLPVLKEFYPDLYEQVVTLNPELETAITLGPSAMEGVSTDPALKQAQMTALMKMQELGEGGMSFEDKARLNQIQTDVNTNLQGQQGAIMQNLATRGMSGGGSELVARQMATQQAANRQAQMGLDVKAQAERRALEAMMNAGQMAGQMQSQDFNQQSQTAQAKDAINKFNSANQQQVMNNNVNAKNTAQQWNAQNAQSTANQNTELNNQTQLHNASLAQQEYENRLKKAGLMQGASNNMAAAYSNQSQGDKQFAGGLISAGASFYGAKK